VKLARFAGRDGPCWGVVDVDRRTVAPVDGGLSTWAPTLCHTQAPISLPSTGEPLPLDHVQLLAPAAPSARIFAVGANYLSHLREIGADVPPQPVAFIKPTSAVVNPGEAISYPAITRQLDYEIELVAVVGCGQIHDQARPSACVLGYTIGVDVTARDLQRAQLGGAVVLDLFSSKALDRTAPIGPWVTTSDEFSTDPIDVELALSVNGHIRQRDRTAQMIWNVGSVLAYLDARTALTSGDLIFTGTPAGVGRSTGVFLAPGDVIDATIEGIGTLRNVVGAPSELAAMSPGGLPRSV
jgi:2-keto-4-pentenoate hydratase/2-oxohepta-3-ene-1,7-dioic acid hydratase in catechol pathway